MRKCLICGKEMFFRRKFCIMCKSLFSDKKYIHKEISGINITREKIRERDKHTCRMCGKIWKPGERRLDVHHVDCDKEKSKKYENYDKEKHNLVTLCHKCHLSLPEHRNSMSNGKKISTDKK